MHDRGRFAGLRRFQIIESIALPKTLGVVGLEGYMEINAIYLLALSSL